MESNCLIRVATLAKNQLMPLAYTKRIQPSIFHQVCLYIKLCTFVCGFHEANPMDNVRERTM